MPSRYACLTPMSPCFSVGGMLTAKTTIFFKFKPIRSTALVFRGRVVTALTFITRQNYHLSHSASLSSTARLQQLALFIIHLQHSLL
jgi:hypothetical protein